MAFFNNYPLLYPDTGAYIFTGFLDGIPFDRPKTYGLFFRHISLGEISWLVVLAQGLLVSGMVYYMLKYFISKKVYLPFHTIIISFLIFFTGVSVISSMLIPDIFTPIFLMAFAVLLILPIENKIDFGVLSLVCWLAIIMHNSHIFIALGIISFLTLLSFFKTTSFFTKKHIIRCWVIIGISILSVPSIHYLTNKEFVISKGSHVFLMNHLVEIGVVDQFLKDRCPDTNYSLCDFQGNISTDFIWSNESPIHVLWGWSDDIWTESKEEYSEIIMEIFTNFKYLKIVAYKSITYTAKQFFSFNAGDTAPRLKKSAPYGAISIHYPDEIREQELALQQRRNNELNFVGMNARQLFTFLFCLSFYVFIFFTPRVRARLSKPKKQLLLFIMLALVMNAFFCGNLSTIVPRYQCRVVWLLPLTVAICLIELIPNLPGLVQRKAS